MDDEPRFGIDLGGVIGPTYKERRQPDGTIGLAPGPKPDALRVLRFIQLHWGEVFIVSRVSSPDKVEANWAWLHHWRVLEEIGIPEENVVIYVGERSEKANHIERLRLNVMIDDRMEILAEMPKGVQTIAFNPDPAEVAQYVPRLSSQGDRIWFVDSWARVGEYYQVAD